MVNDIGVDNQYKLLTATKLLLDEFVRLFMVYFDKDEKISEEMNNSRNKLIVVRMDVLYNEY